MRFQFDSKMREPEGRLPFFVLNRPKARTDDDITHDEERIG